MIPGLELLLLGLMVVCAFLALEGTDLLSSVIFFGVFSFAAAAFYAVLGAVDVAFTEAVLGAVIATAFFVSAIHRSTRSAEPDREPKRRWSWLVLAGAALALGLAGRRLPALGDPASPPTARVSPRYIESGHSETGARNLVTGVIIDYRGYDTLGETVVIFTAGLACLLILPGAWRRRS